MPWVIARSLRASSLDFAEQCERQAIPAYCPVVLSRVRIKRSRRPVVKRYPAFPGYTFIDLNAAPDAISRLREVPFFSGFLRWPTKELIRVDDDEIERIRRNEAAWAEAFRNRTKPRYYRVGEEITLKAGPFAGRAGNVTASSSGTVELELIGGLKVKIRAAVL